MIDKLEQAAKIAEKYGHVFGEPDGCGERGTVIVRRTANAIAALIRNEISADNKGYNAG